MNLREFKYQILDRGAQVVQFDADGVMLDSCHTLADLSPQLGRSVQEEFVFAQSIFAQLKTLQPGQSLLFEAVEFELAGRAGLFDFEFFHSPYGPHYFWLLIDRSTLYHKLRDIQGERNRLRIAIERLEGMKNASR